MSSKKDLEDKTVKLKELLVEAHEKIKQLTSEKEAVNLSYKNRAVGAHFDSKKKEWYVVELEFDLDNKVGRVISTRNVGSSYDMVAYRVKEFLAEKILLPILKEEK